MNKSAMKRVVLLLLLVVGISMAVIYRDQFDAAAIEHWVERAGIVGPIVFMMIYILATVLFLPGSVLTLAGGALFGPILGTFLSLTGATIGATLAFLIARYLASDWVENKVGGRLRQLKEGVEAEGWRFVMFVRLVPLFPFNLLNYALGLTRIRLSHYIIASYLFMLPGGLAYTYLGYAGREAIAGSEGLIQKGLLALSLLAVVAFIPRLIGRLRQKPMLTVEQLRQRLDAGEDILILDVRNPDEYTGEQGHIPRAVNIPLPEIKARSGEISTYADRPVAIVCQTDRRSLKAARILSQQGFVDVSVVKNGMVAWNSSGFAVA